MMRRLQATRDPAADPRPGPMGMERSFAARMMPATIRKYAAKPIELMTPSSYSRRSAYSGGGTSVPRRPRSPARASSSRWDSKVTPSARSRLGS
mgnify:CR=1 FL=1